MEFRTRLTESASAAGAKVDSQQIETLRTVTEALSSAMSPAGQVTSGNMGELLNREVMQHSGYLSNDGPDTSTKGADFRNLKEFGEGAEGYREWMFAVFSNLWPHRKVLSESVREFFTTPITTDWIKGKLTDEERDSLLNKVDGLFLVHNWNINLLSCNGDIYSFTATPKDGGMISPNEKDRLGFPHLKDQVRDYKGVGLSLGKMDEWARENTEDISTTPESYCRKLLSRDVGLEGQKRLSVFYQKELAIAWYRILGFADSRKYAAKHDYYAQYMPKNEKDLETPQGKAMYEKAISYKGWSLEYASPYFFLMDPLTLIGGILDNYKDVVDNIRVGVKSFQSEHQIFNLGWRPAGWLMLEKLTGKSIKPAELKNISLEKLSNGKSLSSLTEDDWKKFIDDDGGDILLQTQNIKFVEKANKAREAFMGCFSLDPKSFGDLYAGICALIRVDKKEENLYTREHILPLTTKAIQEIIEWGRTKLNMRLPIDRSKMLTMLSAIQAMSAPVKPFSESQKQYFLDSCSTSDAAVMFSAK